MSRTQSAANRLREVLLSGRWIANTNIKDQLEDLTWEQATHTIGELNSIAALTFHVNYYIAGLLHFFERGELTIRDTFSFDLPTIQSESDWNDLVKEFLSNATEFANQVEQMEDSILDEIFVDEKYGTYLRNIEGMIEHAYYHLGQMVLIKKMRVERENK